jgi:hypothetical protein
MLFLNFYVGRGARIYKRRSILDCRERGRMVKKIILVVVVFLLVFSILISGGVLAHDPAEGGNDEEKIGGVEEKGINFSSPVTYIIISGSWFLALIIFILTMGRGVANRNKKLFFWMMIVPVALSSLYLAGYTVYENINSATGGPVHWHADYEVRVCGETLELVDPEGIKNKIGNPTFHEHNDDRIHIEGSVEELVDVSLGKYFETIGGELDHGHLVFHDEHKGVIDVEDGYSCPGGGEGSLKVYINGKLDEHFEDYVIYPDPNVPPGDCIIVVFDDSNYEETEILCVSWEIQGWSYDNFVREEVTIGGKTWK